MIPGTYIMAGFVLGWYANRINRRWRARRRRFPWIQYGFFYDTKVKTWREHLKELSIPEDTP